MLLLLVACASSPPPEDGAPGAVQAPAPPETPSIQADLHVDTLSVMVERDLPLDAAALEAGLPRLREGGTNLVVEAIWPQRSGGPARVEALLSRFEAEDERLDEIALARTPAEARRIVARSVAVVLSLEGAHGLAADWRADLDALHARGLRMLGLTWSVSNRFAGSSGDGGGGLTADGVALVARARELGILVDVSHASRPATLDACRSGLVVASHSAAAAVHDAPRNLSDEEIRCIAASGGVIGLNLHAPFLGGERDLEAAVAHYEHLVSVGGEGVVALGTDLDGYIEPPRGLEHAGKLPDLLAALRSRGWSEERIAGLRGENFLRAWEAAGR